MASYARDKIYKGRVLIALGLFLCAGVLEAASFEVVSCDAFHPNALLFLEYN